MRGAFIKLITLLFSAVWLVPHPVQAQNKQEPLEITADNTLEWDREKLTFTAKGNAFAKQGELSINADTLRADYREANAQAFDIQKVEATGSVVLKSRENTAYGAYAVYTLEKGLAVLEGDNLRMEAPNQTVTAEQRFEYWVEENRVEAIGNPKITHINEQGRTNTLQADRLTATLKNNAAGELIFHTLEATGDVLINTPTETLRGRYAMYNAETNIAEMTGGVKITRGPNILEGEKASVNLNTNISRLSGSNAPDGRVRGVFYPEQ